MIDIKISKYLKEKYPKLSLGIIQYEGNIEEKNEFIFRELEVVSENVKELIKKEEINFIPKIKSIRDAYKELGDPSRYRISSEALLRRIFQGKNLYTVNNIVDINNIVSLKSLYPVGSYDLDKIKEPINFRVGLEGEVYSGIGKQEISLENMPLFSDEEGPFGSLTSDSKRTMINSESKKMVMILISFSGNNDFNEIITFAIDLLKKYSSAKKIEYKIIN